MSHWTIVLKLRKTIAGILEGSSERHLDNLEKTEWTGGVWMNNSKPEGNFQILSDAKKRHAGGIDLT